MFTEFKHISYSKGLAILLLDLNYQKIWSEWLYPCVILSLIFQKCLWKKYRQPKNGRKIHDSSALLLPLPSFRLTKMSSFMTDTSWTNCFTAFLDLLEGSRQYKMTPKSIGIIWTIFCNRNLNICSSDLLPLPFVFISTAATVKFV